MKKWSISKWCVALLAVVLGTGLAGASVANAGTWIRVQDGSAADKSPLITHTGTGWTSFTWQASPSLSYAYSPSTGATARFTFTGTAVRWSTTMAYNAGIAAVHVDSDTPDNVDLYYGPPGSGVTRYPTNPPYGIPWTKSGLTNASHTIYVVNTGTRNPSATGGNVGVDFFEYYVPSTYVITPTHGANGSITPSTGQTVTEGGSSTFAIAADPGYHVAFVAVDGANVGAVSSYTFSNVTGNHSITAGFAANTPVVGTPADSPWSLGLGALLLIGTTWALMKRRSPSA